MPENKNENFVEKDRRVLIDAVKQKEYNEIEKVKCRNEHLEGKIRA